MDKLGGLPRYRQRQKPLWWPSSEEAMIIYAPGQSPDLPSFNFYVGTPKECTLVFSEPEWKYYRVDDGSHAPQDGVTTVLHRAVDRSAPLSAWSVKMAMAD